MLSINDSIQAKEEKIAELIQEAEAILAVAEEDNGRNLAAEEQTRYDAILGKDGEVNQLRAQIGNLQELQRKKDILSQARDPEMAATMRMSSISRIGDGGGYGELVDSCQKPVIVPTACRRHRPVKLFKSPAEAYAVGRWIFASIFKHEPSIVWCRDHGMDIYNQQQIGDPGKGGNLVPTPLERAVIEVREMYGVARRHCRIYPMTAETLDVPKFATGLVSAPAAELSDLLANNETDKTWSQVPLVARKWATYTRISSEIMEDAIIDMTSDLARDIGIAMAYSEDDSLFNGDGTGSYNSITGIRAAMLASSKVTAAGNSVGAITLANYEEMIGKAPNLMGADNWWFCHKSVYANSMLSVLHAAGGNTISGLETGARQGNDPMDPNGFFLGYPVRFTNVLPKSSASASTDGVVVFGDPRIGVAFGDRRGLQVALDGSRHFELDAYALRGTCRFDIQVHETGSATPTDNAGALVQLDLPA